MEAGGRGGRGGKRGEREQGGGGRTPMGQALG